MNNFFYAVALLFFLAVQPALASQWPSIELTKLTQDQWPQSVVISVEDPVYNANKKYKAYPLNILIKRLKIPDGLDKDKTLIVFTATDGYKVYINYNDAISEQGYLAFQDTEAPPGKSWIAFKFGKKMITPTPYYLVWPKKNLNKWQFPWPFQVVSVSLQSYQGYFGTAVPSGNNAQAKNGFDLFSRYCIRCHAVNHAGGTLAPELNTPKNVTELYSDSYLKGLIIDAPAYIPKTKMPSFQNILTEQHVEDILLYLKKMKSEKIK